MRLHRHSWLAVAALTVLTACESDAIISQVTRDGSGNIPVIDLSNAAAGGFASGTRAINRFIMTSFDTATIDAFSRATTNPPYFRNDPNSIYGTTQALIYGPNSTSTNPFTPPIRLRPALTDTARAVSFYAAPNNRPILYIVPGGHPANGGVWEFWVNLDQLAPSTRYVMGLVRYNLVVNGALDWSEMLQTGTITAPDSLVLPAGSVMAGRKADGVYTTTCADPDIVHPTAGANPHLVGGGTTDAGGLIEIDQTACSNAASPWFNGLGDPFSPVPKNNTAPLTPNQYNFLVIWEANPDSTPNLARPVFRLQIGPLYTATGLNHNNAFAPFPTAALTAAQLAAAAGASATADTIRVTGSALARFPGLAYSLWLVDTLTNQTAKVTGQVIRRTGATANDTLNGVNEFTLTGLQDGATVTFAFGAIPGTWNAVVLAAGTPGANTLPTLQPLWNTLIKKDKGTAAPGLSLSLAFGSFNGGGASKRPFGAAGTATGGIFGAELREDVKRLPRPPLGYYYEAWLVHSTDSVASYSLGPLLTPYPDLQSLVDADVSTAPPVAGSEITQAAVRFEAATTAFYCVYDRVQIRLQVKGVAAVRPPGIVLSGTNPRTGC